MRAFGRPMNPNVQPVQDMRIPDAVLRITRHKGRGIETEHPAVFPVALPDFLMRAYADEGDVVFEPFAGAGTTIIAGQRTSRRVRAIELAPAYVDLAIARWRMLHPDLPVTLVCAGGRESDTDAIVAEGERLLGDKVQRVEIPYEGKHLSALYYPADGLKPGERVATSGLLKLRNDAEVVVNNKVQPVSEAQPKPENR